KVMGFGAEIAAMVVEDTFEYLKAPVKRVTTLDVPISFAPELEDYVVPTDVDIVDACRDAVKF
ncbi:MAG: hypothetical protein KAR21_22555, partial [Spirochaetales bacterium]|nr:hypothetical protein [Spirochaetales bacterium]